MEHQTRSRRSAVGFDIGKINALQIGKSEEMRQNLTWLSCFAMQVLNYKSALGEAYVYKWGKEGLWADIQPALDPTGNTCPGKAKELFIRLDHRTKPGYNRRLFGPSS